MCPILRSIQENNCSHGSYCYGVRHFFSNFLVLAGIHNAQWRAVSCLYRQSCRWHGLDFGRGGNWGIIPGNPMMAHGWSGWWWLEHGYYFPYIYILNLLGMSSSQLTNSYFSEGLKGWNHQPAYNQIVSLFQDHLWPSKSKKNRSGSDLELYDIELQLDQRHLSGTEQNASSCPGLSGFHLQNPCISMQTMHIPQENNGFRHCFVTLSHCDVVLISPYI